MSEFDTVSRIEDAAGARAGLVSSLRATAAGDRAAFENVYQLTSAKLFGVCLRILSDRLEAEEALQDTYLSVWRRAGSFDARQASAMTWLITIARNRAIDRLRARSKFATAPIEMAETVVDRAPHADAMLVSREEQERLAYCLGTLDEGDAGFVRAAFLQGSSYPELARRAEMPLGTIKSRVRRALLKLRTCLQ